MHSRSLNDFSNEGLRSPERWNSLEKYVCMMPFSEEPQLRVVDGVQVSILHPVSCLLAKKSYGTSCKQCE